MKRLGAFVAAILILMQVQILVVSGADTPHAEMVFSFVMWHDYELEYVVPLALGADIKELEFPNYAWAYNAETGDRYLLRHTWRYDEFDDDILGYQNLIADIEMPLQYTYIGDDAEFVVPVFSLRVLIYDPEAEIPIIEISELSFTSMNVGLSLPIGSDVGTLNLPHFVYTYDDATYERYLLRHTWRFDEFNSGSLGYQELVADIHMPMGYEYNGEDPLDPDPSFSAKVLVYDPESTEPAISAWTFSALTPFETLPLGPIPLGTSVEDLIDMRESMSGRASVKTLDVYYYDYDVEMDVSLIDTSQVGTYYPFSPPPSYIGFTPECLQDTAIYVIDPNEVDLRAWKLFSSGGGIKIDWIKQIEEPELFVSVNDGQWQHVDTLVGEYQNESIDGSDLYNFDLSHRRPFTNQLEIHEHYFITGNTYEFEIHYANGGRSINTYKMDLRDGHLQYFLDGDGDRGGNGREGMIDPYDSDPPPADPLPESTGGSDNLEQDVYTVVKDSVPNIAEVVQEANALNDLAQQTQAGFTTTYPKSASENDGIAPTSPQTEKPLSTTPDSAQADAYSSIISDAEITEPVAGNSISGTASIVVVCGLSAVGVAVFWKLFGKRLVKPH